MAKIKGLENITNLELQRELQNGAKFVIFTYAISLLVITFRRSSDVHLIRASDSAFAKGWPYLLLSMTFGWWGIPWGPIYTVQSIYHSFGGKNVTNEVLASINEDSSYENY